LRPYPSLAIFGTVIMLEPHPRQADENSRLCLGYTKFSDAKTWLKNTEAWQAVRAIGRAARQYVAEVKKSAALAFRQS
jgi:hypothetical protein